MATDTTVSLSARITQWMTDHPGRYRPAEVADSLPVPDGQEHQTDAWWRQKVTNEMARMGRKGTLERVRVNDKGMGPGVLYWLPGTILRG